MSSPLIEVRDFSFEIDGRRILEAVSFEVAAGEHLSIIGPNGAGKTTLLRCLLGIQQGGTATGEVRVAGRPLADYRRRELARLVSYVPQDSGRRLPYTAGEFVSMGRYPYLGPFSPLSAADRRAVEHALEVTGAARFVDRLMDTLSGGERQEVFVAAALAQEARAMFLDEPTTFLDYRHQISVSRILKEANRGRGVTVVSVTHDVNAALDWSSRILALREGRKVYDGPPERLTDLGVLEGIYGTAFWTAAHPGGGHPVVLPRGEA